MAVADLNPGVLHRPLVVLLPSLVLEHELFLVVEDLLRNGVARPRVTVALQVHPRLGEQVLSRSSTPLRLHSIARYGRESMSTSGSPLPPAGLPGSARRR